MRWRVWVGVVATLAVLSIDCKNKKPPEHPVKRMAPFDLNCPKEQLQYHKLDADTWGVRGCGRQAKYVKICRQAVTFGIPQEKCRWVQN